MREIRTLRSMSGKRKRSAGFDTKPKPPRLFSTLPSRKWHTTVYLIVGMSRVGVRRVKAALSSGCKSHPANSLQPEAIGAVMEVTKWLKPSISVSRIGDSASVQAAT